MAEPLAPDTYAQFLADLKGRIRTAQLRASMAVNRELVLLFWQIGRDILDRQQRENWGAKVIDRLAADLKREFPDMKGFSPRNLKYMRRFAEVWAGEEFVQQVAAQLPWVTTSASWICQGSRRPHLVRQATIQTGPALLADRPRYPRPATAGKLGRESDRSSRGGPQASLPRHERISPRNLKYMRAFADAWPDEAVVQAVLAQLTWYHNLAILEKPATPEDRIWYAKAAIQRGWSRNVLVHQIESGRLHRQGKAVANFDSTLPAPQSDLARDITKDPYNFDEAHERDLERGLPDHLRQFLLELGVGFAFVGNQYRLAVGDQEFYIDLLFYHLKLRAYVVIDGS